jgi:DNA-binding transcriptional MerR regulator
MTTTEALLEATAKLYKHRGRIDIKLDELVGIANELINLVVPRQPSDRVAEILNERSLRYYITEGLIDRPVGKEGTAALYGYRHLLQALIVKALQGAYLPIKRIREILAGKNDQELEAILNCQILEFPKGKDEMRSDSAAEWQELDTQTARRKALDYLNYLQEPPPPSIPEAKMVAEEPPAVVFNALQSGGHFPRGSVNNKELPASDSWERFWLEDGVELHVRTDRVKGLRGSEIKRILERVLNLLKNRK